MPSANYIPASKAIGLAFKAWRDEKRLSLRQVEVASRELPEPVGFEYLSKVERGLVMPSVGKLATLASIYGRPIYELIDLYETVRMRALAPARGAFKTFRRLGREHLENGDLYVAIGCFLGALELAEGTARPDRDRLAAAYTDVGHALVEAGRHIAAMKYFEDALRNATDPGLQGSLLGDLAIAHHQVGNTFLAEVLAGRGLALAETDETTKSKAYAVLARILFDQGRYEEAEPRLRVAIAGLLVNHDVPEAVKDIANLGLCLVKMGKSGEGLGFLSDAVKRAGEKNKPRLRALALLMHGKGLYFADRVDEATGPLSGALRIARDHDLRDEGFHSAYYLWRIAAKRGSRADEVEYIEIARVFRPHVMGSAEEVAYFDENVPHIRRRKRRRAGAHRTHAAKPRRKSSE